MIDMTHCSHCHRAQPDEHVLWDRCVGCSLAVRQTVLQRAAHAARLAEDASPASEEIRAASERHHYRTMDPVPAPAPENRPC